MIWVLSVLLLLLDAGLAVPVNGSQVAVTNSSINTLHETVKGLEKSIEVLYSKLKVVQNQVTNSESGLDRWEESATYTVYRMFTRMQHTG